MAFPGAASTDLDPCPLHTERLSFLTLAVQDIVALLISFAL